MLELRSDSLVVSILDPNDPADADKNGARYCTGGPRPICFHPMPPSSSPASITGRPPRAAM